MLGENGARKSTLPRVVAGERLAAAARVLAQGTPDAVLTPELIRDGFAVAARVQPHPLTRRSLIATAAAA